MDSIDYEENLSEISTTLNTNAASSDMEVHRSPLKLKAQRIPISRDSGCELTKITGIAQDTQMNTSFTSPALQETELKRKLTAHLKEGFSGSPLKIAVKLIDDAVYTAGDRSYESMCTKRDTLQKESLQPLQKEDTSSHILNLTASKENGSPTEKKSMATNQSTTFFGQKDITDCVNKPQKHLRAISKLHGLDHGSRITKVQTKICPAPAAKVRHTLIMLVL